MWNLHLGDTLRGYLTGGARRPRPRRSSRTPCARASATTRCAAASAWSPACWRDDDFIIDPLPNLLFTRDSSVWIRDHVAITSLAMPARERETQLTELIYHLHPRFAGTPRDPRLAPRVTSRAATSCCCPRASSPSASASARRPAGAERLARQMFGAGLVETVLAVPITQERATMHLDTVCTMVDVDKIVMYPNVADHLQAYAVTVAERTGDDDLDLVLDVAPAEPFLVAAAKAMGIDTLHQIDTGLDPVTAEREQWDDGNNTLALAPRVAVAYERNTETNARLEAAGIEVVAIAGSELGSGRGGPRCMSCPIARDPDLTRRRRARSTPRREKTSRDPRRVGRSSQPHRLSFSRLGAAFSRLGAFSRLAFSRTRR